MRAEPVSASAVVAACEPVGLLELVVEMDLIALIRAYWSARRNGLMEKYGKTTVWGVIAGACALMATVAGNIEAGQPVPWREILPEILAIVSAVVALIRLRIAVAKSGPTG